MSYQSMEEIRKRCEAEGIEFWKAVQLEDCNERGASTEDSWNDEITEDELHAIEFDLQIRELLRTLLQNRKYSMWYRLFSFISVLEKINEAHQKQDEMTVFELLNHFFTG